MNNWFDISFVSNQSNTLSTLSRTSSEIMTVYSEQHLWHKNVENKPSITQTRTLYIGAIFQIEYVCDLDVSSLNDKCMLYTKSTNFCELYESEILLKY